MMRVRFRVSDSARNAGLLLLCGAAFSLGCGQGPGDHPPVYPVNGKVLYKGKPISGGVVLYELEGGDSSSRKADSPGGTLRATGKIAADGSFRLMAFSGTDGVPEGKYRVGISSMPPRSEGNLLEVAGNAKKGNPDVLAGRYADPSKSGLRTEVFKDQANEPKFDLK
jgi:hypothetical protein